MIEQGKFLDMLHHIMEKARNQDNTISKDELKDMLGENRFSEEQLESVYAYLAENKIKVQGFEYVKQNIEKEEVLDTKSTDEDSKYLKMYKEDLESIKDTSWEKKEQWFQKAKEGKTEEKKKLETVCLHDVLKIAQKYKNRRMKLEDLIQEGNLGMINALEHIPVHYKGTGKEYILGSAKACMVSAIDEGSGEESAENAIVAKANLIREAAEYLEKDFGRAPSVLELEEFTKIPAKEIKDIIHLSKK